LRPIACFTPRILRAGKATKYSGRRWKLALAVAATSEAELIRDLLVEFGVPDEVITLETESRSTHENAVNAAAIFQERNRQSGLLVTSGSHMPRALAAPVWPPAATDIQATYPLYSSPLDLLPDATALVTTTAAVKERVRLIVYRYRGWA
jgi:uncharacterized SAM-binding protein YcdF (DUF218 family)